MSDRRQSEHQADGPTPSFGGTAGETSRDVDVPVPSSHTAAHDPTVDHVECFVCEQALGAAFARLTDLPLGPAGPAVLIRKIRELAGEAIALGAAS